MDSVVIGLLKAATDGGLFGAESLKLEDWPLLPLVSVIRDRPTFARCRASVQSAFRSCPQPKVALLLMFYPLPAYSLSMQLQGKYQSTSHENHR